MSAKNGSVLKCVICNESKYVSTKRLNSFKYCSYMCAGIAKKGIIPKMAYKIKDPRITGDGNPAWKGDEASYIAKHRWVKKWFGFPDHCENDKTHINVKYNWSNISGKYKRERNDWQMLCVSCHRKYDKHGEKSRVTYYKNHPQYVK